MKVSKLKCYFNNSCNKDTINPLILSTTDIKSTLYIYAKLLKELRKKFKDCSDIPSILKLKAEYLKFNDNYLKYLYNSNLNKCYLDPTLCNKKYIFELKRKKRFERLLSKITFEYNQIQDLIIELENYNSIYKCGNISLKHSFNNKTHKHIVLIYDINELSTGRSTYVMMFYGDHYIRFRSNMFIKYYFLYGELELIGIDVYDQCLGYGSILLENLKLIVSELNNYLKYDKTSYPVKCIIGTIMNKSPEQYERLKKFYFENGFFKDECLYCEID